MAWLVSSGRFIKFERWFFVMATKKVADKETIKEAEGKIAVLITAPAFKTAQFTIRGDSPFVQLRFSQKQRAKMHADHGEGEKEVKTKKPHAAKDFDGLYQDSMYMGHTGQRGINMMSFKKSMVAACRLTTLNMKMAKMSFFIQPDDYDVSDEIPLVLFTRGEPHYCEHITRNANGMPDLRVRAMWDAGWECVLRVKYDSEILSLQSVTNLLIRGGAQVGIGEGRPDSTKSDGAGMGWGTFEVLEVSELK
jgi:hypothetical protein